MTTLRHMAREQAKQIIFMEVAHSLAKLGTCPRKAVGAVLVRDGRCISWGFNGAPPGAPHCEDNNHGWSPKLQGDETPEAITAWREAGEDMLREMGCRNATHAEANALAFAAKQGISTDDASLYVTVAPCDTCAKLLIASGVRRVYYAEEYRDPAGIELLQLGGIGAVHLRPPTHGGLNL